ncbi:hypothetical protein [Terriglobus sp. TAA 43]|uniref:hypothetical protein n=1 Tax=Terriglobus sp. TAA 43 TaxID=278961 RepID=UPI00064761E7|nr:hypothetical protein [Terriglobus sp. TAA 43]
MRVPLRQTTFVIGNATYRSGDYSNNLLANDLVIDVQGDRCVLSLDLSPSQPSGREMSQTYTDAEDLKENFVSLEFLQFHREGWLENGLRDALQQGEPSEYILELHFKDGSRKTTSATFEFDAHDLWIRPVR